MKGEFSVIVFLGLLLLCMLKKKREVCVQGFYCLLTFCDFGRLLNTFLIQTGVLWQRRLGFHVGTVLPECALGMRVLVC